jgi:hypothetical protein
MAYFSSTEEIDRVIGGFLQKFPRLEPLLREATGYRQMTLKLELKDPEFNAEIDFTRSPLEIRFNTNADGSIGMACTADDFHRVLLGMLPIGIGIDRKRLLMRHSVAKLISAVPLFYLAPAIYPFYLESINRPDLIISGERPALHGKREMEESMTKIVSGLAYLVGYGLGFFRAHIAPGLDIVAALESLGNGLLKATPQKGPKK